MDTWYLAYSRKNEGCGQCIVTWQRTVVHIQFTYLWSWASGGYGSGEAGVTGNRGRERWSDGDMRMKWRSSTRPMITLVLSSSHSSKFEKMACRVLSKTQLRLCGAFQTSTHCMSDTCDSLSALFLRQSQTSQHSQSLNSHNQEMPPHVNSVHNLSLDVSTDLPWHLHGTFRDVSTELFTTIYCV